MSENRFQCPHETDADFICSVLVTELSVAKTLHDKIKIANAILDLRQFTKPMIKEWEHVNGIASRLTDVEGDTTKIQAVLQDGFSVGGAG